MSTKRTPLTTRPASTSRQGMMRLASMQIPSGSAAAQLVEQTLARGEVERALVDRAPGDGADDVGLARRAERTDVVEVGDATRCDHRDVDRGRQATRRLDVDAGEHAVAADVRVDDRLHAVALEVLRH